ncbi:MAG TPA: DUF167 domain-containing protein [Pyrinomonadaceae bacterium]|nr:DUF167 domain-containing protein [Pyrinomonadaceae bacterium]
MKQDLIQYSLKNDRLEIRVHVVPRASKSEVVGEHDGSLRVRIAAPPVDGAANEELIRVLAKTFDVPRRAVSIVSGEAGRIKHVRIESGARDLKELLRSLIADRG